MSELIFSASDHQYTLDGVKIPSVTQLTEVYSTYETEEYPDMELTMEAAAERGSILHGYLEHRLRGGVAEDYEMPASYAPYADAVDLFLAEHEVEMMFAETPMWGSARDVTFAGTPDFIGWMDGTFSILDWKFVSQVQKTKVGAQLKGYDALCNFWGIFPEALACVQFLADGTYRLYRVEQTPDAFDACLHIERLKRQKHPKGRIL